MQTMNSSLIPLINEDIYKELIKDKIIHSGMIPKLRKMPFNAINKGVNHVWMGLPENLLLASRGKKCGHHH